MLSPVFNAPKLIQDYNREGMMKEGLRMAALVKAVQEIAKQLSRPAPRIEMSPFVHQPKIEVLKKIYSEGADVVVLGNGRYPADALGNIASYVVFFCLFFACICTRYPEHAVPVAMSWCDLLFVWVLWTGCTLPPDT